LECRINSQLIDVNFPQNQIFRSQIDGAITELNYSPGIFDLKGQLAAKNILNKAVGQTVESVKWNNSSCLLSESTIHTL
jgi:hypothetical protein